MSDDVLTSAEWYRATTLAERIAARRSDAAARPPEGAELERARADLAEWKAQAPFDRGDAFAERLAAEGIAEGELLGVLAEPPERVRARFPAPPPWLAELALAYGQPRGAGGWSLPLPPAMHGARTVAFLEWLEPLIRQACGRFGQDIRERVPEFAGRDLVPLFSVNVAWPLHTLVARTLVLELNVARMAGELAGATGEERFQAFIERLRDPDRALALLAEYPVLARRAVEALERWRAAGLGFLGHLGADAAALERRFAPPGGLGALVEVAGGAGDVHRGGRSVMVARFESGVRLVYKPRSLAVDLRFQELLEWLNARGDHPPFRTLAVLDCGDHGWMEFAAHAPCAAADEVARFYRRQGGYAALLYALEATDFHFENLIAAGEQPLLVDLETLFHGRPPDPDHDQADVRIVSEAIGCSALRSGLLPNRTWSDSSYGGIDLSGLGGAAGQLTPDRVLQWEQAGTDEMRAQRRRMAMPGAQNLPSRDGTAAGVLEHRRELEVGFAAMYRLLYRQRQALLAPDGPLERFRSCEVRSVLRATRGYGLLAAESSHPDFLRDALEGERFLDRLWLGIPDNPYLARAVAYERRDLLQGDIPFFATRPGERALYASRGERIADFWGQSGFDGVARRLGALSERDLEVQLWFVRASLATLTLEQDALQWPSYAKIEASAVPERAELDGALLGAAEQVARRIEAMALRSGSDVTWIGLAFNQKQWGLVSLLEDLYAGVSGVALFLGYFGAVAGDERATALARCALGTLRARLERTRAGMRCIGGFNGIGGIAYAFTHLGALWSDESLLADAAELARAVREHLAADQDLDVIGGAAGALLALLGLHACTGDEAALATAKECGERLLALARPMPVGVGWLSRIETERPITGFSHGGSGIAFALLRLARATGDGRFRATALAAIDYEHTQFVAAEGNWLDLKSSAEGGAGHEALSVAWCYGAPGILLARLEALRGGEHPRSRADADAAINTTLERGFGRNHSLCHGDLGNLDALATASRAPGFARLAPLVDRIAWDVLSSIRRDGVLCGIPLGVESPALMNGLAGAGYGLLRLAAPDRIPSVLGLDPPVRGSRTR